MGATHFKGPLWSANGFVTGPGLGLPGTHFSGPVISANGYGAGAGAGQPGTHFKGPVFSVNGFEGGGVLILGSTGESTDVDATTLVAGPVEGGVGTRVLAFIGFNRQSSTAVLSSVTYGATPMTFVDLIQTATSGIAIYTLADAPGTEDITATFSAPVAGTTGAIIALVLQEGGHGAVVGSGGTSTSVSNAVTVTTGGTAFDGLVLSVGQTPTPNPGQTGVLNLAFGGGTRHLAVSHKTGLGETTLGWSWAASSGFIHRVIPVDPA